MTAAGANTGAGEYRRGQEKRLALGVYPDVTLAQAREARDGARKVLAAGDDPRQLRRDARWPAPVSQANTFEVVARLWWEHWRTEKEARGMPNTPSGAWKPTCSPALGAMPIGAVTAKAPDPLRPKPSGTGGYRPGAPGVADEPANPALRRGA